MLYARLKLNKLLTIVLFSLGIQQAVGQIPLPECGVHDEPSSAECENLSCRLCNLNGYLGSSAGFGADPDHDLGPHFCGSIEAVQNIAFYAAVPNLDITVTASNCTLNSGIDLGLMEGYCDNFPLVDCVPGDGSNSTTLSLNSLNLGPYILIIDVDATGPCDLAISVNPPDGTIPDVPPIEEIIGDFEVCPGSYNLYQVTPYYNGSTYTWTLPMDASITSYNQGEHVLVIWGNTSGDLCVTANHPCNPANAPFCIPVTITPIPPTIFPPVEVCKETLPYELPWGEMISQSGDYSKVIESYKTCDSTLMQTVIVHPSFEQTLAPVQLCETGCLTKCGQTFCGYGNYTVTCQSIHGCDSIINFSIVPPNLVADIQGGGSITCNNPTITLTAASSSGVKTWYNSAGQLLGTGDQLAVDSPGTYILTVTLMLAGQECSKTSSIVIPLNTEPPVATAVGAILGCDTLPAFVHVDSLAGLTSYTWSGPNGFASSLQNPEVNTLGTYIVTVVNLANGCLAKDTVLVTCCPISAGTLDSTMLTVCGEKNLLFNFHETNLALATAFILSPSPFHLSPFPPPPPLFFSLSAVCLLVDLVNGCSAKDTVLVKPCCAISAGTLDSMMLTICGEKNLLFNFHGDQILGPGDSLVFILYSDPADPFGSILLYSDTTIFPFVPGLQQLDSVYYVAAFAGSALPDTSISFQNSCWALSAPQPVRWVQKPGIMVVPSPFTACKGDCMDLTFQFTGVPPFQFHFNITQNGVLLFSQDETSDTSQKTITVCPSTFSQTVGSVSLNFNVNYFQDAVCNCND